MSNKGLIIILIILLSILIFGLVIFLVSALTGNFNFGGIRMGGSNNVVIFDETYKMENIENIEVLSAAGNVTFRESEDDTIRVVAYGKEGNNIYVNATNNKLNVDYTKTSKHFILFGFNSTTNDIEIYIPSNYSGIIKVKNDYGNCEVCDLENATVNAEVNCGNIELGKIRNANLKCDLGNAVIDEVLNKCNIEVDCGNAKIEKAEINENSSIRCDLGDAQIDEINDIYIDANVDLGKTNIGKNNRNSSITLKVEVDCGNVKIAE